MHLHTGIDIFENLILLHKKKMLASDYCALNIANDFILLLETFF